MRLLPTFLRFSLLARCFKSPEKDFDLIALRPGEQKLTRRTERFRTLATTISGTVPTARAIMNSLNQLANKSTRSTNLPPIHIYRQRFHSHWNKAASFAHVHIMPSCLPYYRSCYRALPHQR